MDLGVTGGAWRHDHRPFAYPVNRALGERIMALGAQLVYIRHIQQSSVLRAVRGVAGHTPFRLDWQMLIHERPARIGVAPGTDLILVGGGHQIVIAKGAMNVMAVITGDCALVHRMMERHAEGRLYVAVALVAELRLIYPEQRRRGNTSLFHAGMYAMATQAAQAGPGMRGVLPVGMITCMAAKTDLVNLLRRHLVETPDLRDVAAAFHMRQARSVTAFARHALAGMFQGKTGVRIVSEFLYYISVTSCTCLLTDVSRRNCRRLLVRSRCLLRAVVRSSCQPDFRKTGQQ